MDPHSVNSDYPPHATRISASYLALTDTQKKAPGVSEVWEDWQRMALQLPAANEYKAYCPAGLISQLATRSVELIAVYQPTTPRRTALPVPADQALQAVGGDDLCELVSSGLSVIWHTPHCYDKWKTDFHAILGFT